MIKSDVHIQKRTAKTKKTRKNNEQNHQLHLRHRQCVKYHLHLKSESLFMKSVLNFASSFNIFRRSMQFKIETAILSFQ